MVQLDPHALVVFIGNTPDGAGSPWLLHEPAPEPEVSADQVDPIDEQAPTPVEEV